MRKPFYSAKRQRSGHTCAIEVRAERNDKFPDEAEFELLERRHDGAALIKTRRVDRDGVAEHQVSVQVQTIDSAGRTRTAYGSLALTDEEAAFLAEALTGGARKFVKES